MQNTKSELNQGLSPDLHSTIEFIVSVTIKFFFLVCIPLTTLSLARIFTTGFIPVMGLHITLLLILGFSFFRRAKLSSSFLSLVIVAIFFLLSLGGFFTYFITIYLFPAIILSLGFAALLMSKRSTLIIFVLETFILLSLATFFSNTELIQSIFEVLVYCSFSYFLIFAINKVKESFLELIKNLKKKEAAEKEANEKLAIALNSRSQFLALMSHEIRTPLNSILLASENLEATDLNDDQVELLKVIENSNSAIQVLIKDILEYSKGQAGKSPLEEKPFNLQKLGDQIIEVNKRFSTSNQVSLNYEYQSDSDYYSGDKIKVGQIITNLISNALKFTNQGVVKLIISECSETKQLILTVEDTGIGIKKERLKAIFNEFEQEDNSTTRRFGGTGLGLAIVQQLVQLMKGRLKVESEKNIGSTFSIYLPLKKVNEGTPKKETRIVRSETSEFSTVKLILFEDNQTNANLMIKRFEKMGMELAMSVSNGQQGLELMKLHSFDLVLMDIQMPVLNGIETTKIIRSTVLGKNSQNIPIIGLSANSFHEDIEKALEAGMNDYISKPAKKDEIIDVLRKYIN